MQLKPRRLWPWALALAWCAFSRPAAAREPLSFQPHSLPVQGVVRNFLTADFNEDGLKDVLVTHIVLNEAARTVERYFSLFLQTQEGFPPKPDQTFPAPKEAVGIDAGNFDLSTNGPELGYVASGGVFYFKFDKDRFITSPSRLFTTSTLFRAPDPHGVIKMDFAQDLNGDGQEEIVIADFDQTYLFGARKGDRDNSGWRLVQIFPTPLSSRVSTYWENDVLLSRIEQNSTRIETMLPQLFQGDLDGDGRVDVFVPRDDRVLVYRQLEGGGFADAPVEIDFGVFRLENLMRHGHIPEVTRLLVGDFNGDKLADVVVSRLHVKNLKNVDVYSHLYVFINKAGRYGERPDEVMEFSGFVEQPYLADYNGDGRDDIAIQRFPFGFAQLLRIYFFQSVKVSYELYTSDSEGLHAKDPAESRSLVFDFDLAQQSMSLLTGFSLLGDFNGDGRKDLLQAADADGYEMLLSTPERWADRGLSLPTASSFFTFPEDLNGDGLDDLLVRYAGRGALDSTVSVVVSHLPEPREQVSTR